jgi:hypothetical protein
LGQICGRKWNVWSKPDQKLNGYLISGPIIEWRTIDHSITGLEIKWSMADHSIFGPEIVLSLENQ